MADNLYAKVLDSDSGVYGYRMMINSGTFWRCRHGYTIFRLCWRCGLFHPIRFIQFWWDSKR